MSITDRVTKAVTPLAMSASAVLLLATPAAAQQRGSRTAVLRASAVLVASIEPSPVSSVPELEPGRATVSASVAGRRITLVEPTRIARPPYAGDVAAASPVSRTIELVPALSADDRPFIRQTVSTLY